MTVRRAVALLLLLTVGLSSAEVVLADEPPAADGVASGTVHAVSAATGSGDDAAPADDCACLCACGCVNAQVVVAPEPVEFCGTGVDFVLAVEAPLVFAKRARARPHPRPPLA